MMYGVKDVGTLEVNLIIQCYYVHFNKIFISFNINSYMYMHFMKQTLCFHSSLCLQFYSVQALFCSHSYMRCFFRKTNFPSGILVSIQLYQFEDFRYMMYSLTHYIHNYDGRNFNVELLNICIHS